MSPTVALDVTRHAKPPRALFLPFRMGHQFGIPHHNSLQTEIVLECLNLLRQSSETWVLGEFAKTWAQARREAKELAR